MWTGPDVPLQPYMFGVYLLMWGLACLFCWAALPWLFRRDDEMVKHGLLIGGYFGGLGMLSLVIEFLWRRYVA